MSTATTEGAVRVRFVGDDDVIEHIYNLSDASKRKKKVASKGSVAEPSLADEPPLVAGVEQEETPIPIGLHATSDTLTGRQVFNLTCTPKAKHVVKAASKTPSREPRKGSSSTPRQPVTPKSPYSLRRKIKQKLSKMKDEAETSSGDSDSELSSEDDEDEESDQVDIGKYGSYFTSNSRSKTSNHTLTKLGRPVMAPDEINSTLEKVNDLHIKHRAKLLVNYHSCFAHWLALLREGFTILLHGPGSKLKLLQRFKEAVLTDFASITVNGFNPSLSYTEILQSILQCIPSGIGAPFLGSTPVDHIVEHFSKNVWNQETSRRFRFVWINATTFEPYVLESSLEPLKSSASNALSSLKHVFCSLTPNARKIFLLIARHQLDNAESPLYAGMSFHDCYHRCREAFLVNSDLTLRAQLREFLDHMLLKVKKGHDGTENLLIPIEAGALTLFLDQQEEDSMF
ncbi:origin recognition complex subunit 2 isoform X2 [Dermacentor albipictus]|uniref:origin recognition complex subunit 2 isoform X2 n=1 Tax=Dermacentor albipictus TaxID=60249 RepID=UPI0038FC30EB